MARLPQGLVILGSAALLNIVAGYVRQLVYAYHFGAGSDLDAFLVAFTLPQQLLTNLAMISVSVVLPAYARHRERQEHEASRALLHGWFGAVFKFCLLSGVILAVAARPIVSLLAPGFDASQADLAAQYLRWVVPYFVAIGGGSSFQIVLDSHRAFGFPAWSRPLINIIVIGACLAGAARFGPYAAVAGYVLAGLVVFFGLAWRTQRFEPIDFIACLTAGLDRLPIGSAMTLLLATVATQINPMVDNWFASRVAGGGGVAALNYAGAINSIATAVVTTTISTALFPVLSERVARGDARQALRLALRWSAVVVAVSAVPVLGLVTFRMEIVALLFQVGRFDQSATELTASVLVVLPAMVLLGAVSEIVTRLLHALGAFRVVAAFAWLAMGTKVLLSAWLFEKFQLVGLVGATVCAGCVATIGRVAASIVLVRVSSPTSTKP